MNKNLKLFGMEIFLPPEQDDSSPESSGGEQLQRIDEEEHDAIDDYLLDLAKSHDGNPSSELDGDTKPPLVLDSANDHYTENGDKIPRAKPKKPEKILPCPRCNSSDTKFCYYNNYNINQPRHFCRSCQRYWTAGGTMRNVPVGAGRRKSKNPSSSQCHHITVSEALLAAKLDACEGFHCLKLEHNGTLLSFGSESVGGSAGLTGKQAVKNVEGKKGSCSNRGAGNGFQTSLVLNMNGLPVPGPWMPWNSSLIPTPVILPQCHNLDENSAIPWQALPAPGASQGIINRVGSKHSRSGQLKTSNMDNSGDSVLVPKALRLDDPAEAAKSTIWTTLGISHHDSLNRKSIFQAFQPKTGQEKPFPAISPALLANPSALSRSTFFHESA